MAVSRKLFGPKETTTLSTAPPNTLDPSNPSYFGLSHLHYTWDLTAKVFECEGERRNLPQIQFEINTPRGKRYFVTYRNGFDPPQGVSSAVVVSNSIPLTCDNSLITCDDTHITCDETQEGI
jgi:hypothetical protein